MGMLTVIGCTAKKVGPNGPGNSYEVDTPAPTSVTVMGVVNDQNGMPVVGATVRLDDGASTVTDGQGRYRFDDVEPGLHGVAVYKKGRTAGYASVLVGGEEIDAEPVVVKPFEEVEGYAEEHAPVDDGGAIGETVRVETASDGEDGRPALASVSLPKGVKIVGKDGQPVATEGEVPISVAPLSIFEVPGLMGGSEVIDGRIEKDFPVASAEFGPSGVVFDRPVTITIGLPIPLSPGTQLPFRFYNEEAERWEDVTADDGTRVFATVNPDGQSASAGVLHFTTFGIVLLVTVERPMPTEAMMVTNIAQGGDIVVDLGGSVTFSGTPSQSFLFIAKIFLEIEFGLSQGRLSQGFLQSRISFTDRTISSVTVTVIQETFSGVTVSLRLVRKSSTSPETIESGSATVMKKRLGPVSVTRTIPAGHASGHASGHSSGGIHDSGIGF
jgi:hypothetical protein